MIIKTCEFCKKPYQNAHHRAKYCSSCRDNNAPWSVLKTFKGVRLRGLLNGARGRARSKELPFDLTLEDLVELWEIHDGRCSLTGIKFNLAHSGKRGQVHKDAPSLDRIIPELGYVKGNVRLVTYHMNVALSEFGISGFESLLDAYLAHSVNRR